MDNIIEEQKDKVTIGVMDKDDSQLIITEYTDSDIQGMIYEVRGQQVMLDSDLAILYNYELKQFNRQVKNNIVRFPNDFMFQLNNKEYEEILRCKNCTSSTHGGRRYLPFIFTEQGIYMLAAVLKGKIAEQQSILIIRTFKNMKHYLVENRKQII